MCFLLGQSTCILSIKKMYTPLKKKTEEENNIHTFINFNNLISNGEYVGDSMKIV
jgi:hypothetical protein